MLPTNKGESKVRYKNGCEGKRYSPRSIYHNLYSPSLLGMDPCSTPRTIPEFCCLGSLSLHLAGLELGPLRNLSQDLILLATRACTFSDGRDLCRMPFILREHASAPPAIEKGAPGVSSDTRKIPSNTRWCIASSGTITEMRRRSEIIR